MIRRAAKAAAKPRPSPAAPRNPWVRTLILFAAIAVVVLVIGMLLTPYVTRDRVEAWVRGAGAWGPVVLLLVQMAQILAAPIPGVFVPLIAGLLYGPVWGSVLTAVGSLAGSAVAFGIGRAAGRRVAVKWIGREALDKASYLIRGKRWLAMIPLFLFPFSPADALCFVAGIVGMGWTPFLGSILLGRIPKDIVITVGGALGWSAFGLRG